LRSASFELRKTLATVTAATLQAGKRANCTDESRANGRTSVRRVNCAY